MKPNVTIKNDVTIGHELTQQTLKIEDKLLDCLEITEQITKTNKTNLTENEMTKSVRITEK